MTEEREVRKTDPSKIKSNDLMLLPYWVKVTQVPGAIGLPGWSTPPNLQWNVTGLDGGIGNIVVQGKELMESAFSADFYVEEEKVSQTRCAEILVSSFNRPFTVVFEKKEKEEGEGLRTLRGRLVKPEPLLGRSLVEDMDLPREDRKGRFRLVDHRTLKSLIVDGVKYVVKR